MAHEKRNAKYEIPKNKIKNDGRQQKLELKQLGRLKNGGKFCSASK